MSPSTTTTAAAVASAGQQHQQDGPRRRRKPGGHARRTDLDVPLAPLFAPCWAFEVEGAQLRRVLGHCSTRVDKDDSKLVVGCVEDRRRQQGAGLVAATGRVDLLRVPEAHRRYVTRVFWIPQACRDLGWLAFSPALRRAMEEARAAVDAAVGAAAAAPAGGEGTDDAGVGGEAPMRFCVKLNAYPKSLEHVAAELMLEGRCADESELSPSAAHASHVLHICHCPGWSPLFYYGVTRSVRFEAWLAARGLLAPAASSPSAPPGSSVQEENGSDHRRVQIGPAAESAAYRLASSRDKREKERAKALIRVDKALLQTEAWGEGEAAVLPPVSRAYFKMKEIVEDGHLERLGQGHRSWDGARALDVGAAPGGWTQYLSERVPGVARVVAVDGGKVHPGVLARPCVRYVGCRVQDEAARAVMEAEGPFDFVASDVNLFPDEMGDLVAAHVLPHLAVARPCPAGGGEDQKAASAVLALTLKFPNKPTPEREASCVETVLRILEEGGREAGVAVAAHRCVWLHANSSNERTLLAVVVRGRGGGLVEGE